MLPLLKSYTREAIPDLDLNNLFKYAVPKFESKYELCIDEDYTGLGKSVGLHSIENPESSVASPMKRFDTWDDLPLALFWAIYQVMEAESEKV